ncbi:MAG: hypothetical protein HN380_28395 [Victivallales bacterium]|jgi:hypothetical protein|nr:hypothetical protein [Victivallales bacterium]
MRRKQIVIGVATLVASWYGMMAIHEAGHCLGAWLTGATVAGVTFPLLGFSRTDVSGGDHPLLVVWAGPVFGALLPLVMLLCCRRFGGVGRDVVLFFAGFCLLVNGIYIGLGASAKVGDALDLIRCGAPMWHLLAFGATASLAGLCRWHGLGPFGDWFRPDPKQLGADG